MPSLTKTFLLLAPLRRSVGATSGNDTAAKSVGSSGKRDRRLHIILHLGFAILALAPDLQLLCSGKGTAGSVRAPVPEGRQRGDSHSSAQLSESPSRFQRERELSRVEDRLRPLALDSDPTPQVHLTPSCVSCGERSWSIPWERLTRHGVHEPCVDYSPSCSFWYWLG